MKTTLQKTLLGSLFIFFSAGLQAGNFEEKSSASSIDAPLHEEELYLTPGGKYTISDIEENGHMTRSQKYGNFVGAPITDPKVGEQICPITLRRANPNFTWIVDGQTYAFCCPLCIDEFVVLAKEHPDEIKSADEYVLKD